MRPTSDLIESLVADASAVRPLRRPAMRAAGWLVFAVLVLVLVGVAHGVRPDLAPKLRQPVFVTGVAAAALTGALAAVASFIASVPGRSLRWLLLPLPALLMWVSTVGYGCLTDWVSIGPDGISAGETARCFATLGLVGIPLSLTLLIMLRHVALLSPAPVVMSASLAVSALTAVALSMLHPLDATAMILLWNFGVAVVLLWVGRRWATRLFAWVTPYVS